MNAVMLHQHTKHTSVCIQQQDHFDLSFVQRSLVSVIHTFLLFLLLLMLFTFCCYNEIYLQVSPFYLTLYTYILRHMNMLRDTLERLDKQLC